MLYRHFADLCGHEWTRDGVDVVALHLTNESLAELSSDASIGATAMNGRVGYSLVVPSENAPASVRAEIWVSDMINPFTGTVTKVSGGGDEDTAVVQVGIDENGDPVTRSIALAAA